MRSERAFQEITSSVYRPMSELEVGEDCWFNRGDWRDLMRRVTNVQRYPRQMRDRRFTSRLFIAFEQRDAEAMPIRLVRVHRVE